MAAPLPLKVIVPITEWRDRYTIAPWMVRVDADRENGLSKSSAADAFQVRSVSEQRFVQRLGHPVAIARLNASLDARRIDFDSQKYSAIQRRRQRLRATHPAQAA